MTGEPTNLFALALTTAVLGMGVVFVALFLLSVSMHYFKILTARMEEKHRASAPPPPVSRTQAPARTPAPPRPNEPQLAAAVAVGLFLKGVRMGVEDEVAAAIALALELEQRQDVAAERGPVLGWGAAGRLETQAMRERLQRRSFTAKR